MSQMFPHVLNLFVMTTICNTGFGLYTEVFPETVVESIDDDVTITCLANYSTNSIRIIDVLRVGKVGENSLAILHVSGLQNGSNITSDVTAEGKIEDNARNSYLRITIRNPDVKDAGMYCCQMYYVDGFGVFKVDEACANVKVDISIPDNTGKPVIIHLLKEMKDLKKTVKVLDNKVKDEQTKRKTVESEVSVLENTVKKLQGQQKNMMQHSKNKTKALEKSVEKVKTELRQQEERLDEQAEKASFQSAFTAGFSSSVKVAGSQDLVFSMVYLNTGGDYNATSGVYTAPRNGTYVFHLMVETGQPGEYINVIMKVNGNGVAYLHAGHGSSQDQSTVTRTVSLKAGDTVWPYLWTIGYGDHLVGYPFTLFTGYLLKLS